MLRSFSIKYKNQTCKFRGAEISEIAPQKPLLVCFLVYKKRVVSQKGYLNRIPIRNSSKIHRVRNSFIVFLKIVWTSLIVLRIALRFLIVRYFSSLVLILLRRSFANHLSSYSDYLNESINDYIQKIIAW